MKKLNILTVLAMMVLLSTTALADATFSDNWKQDSDGTWRVYDQNGKLLTDAWFCDDAVPSNGKDVWYLLDKDGNMVSAGLVQDGTGNFYSLETNHNGYYGMLRYLAGTYDGINLDLESSHDGSFAAIKNQDAIDKLKAKYGLKVVDINNDNIVYSSDIVKTDFGNNGWVTYSNGSTYYYKNGTPVKGWQTIDGKQYCFEDSTGILYKSCYTPDGYYVDADGVWDNEDAATTAEEQAEKSAKMADDSKEVQLIWDAEGKALMKQYGDKAIAALQSGIAMVTEAKSISDRKTAAKKYYAAVGKASGASEYLEYMNSTASERPVYKLTNGKLVTAAVQEAINLMSPFESFEIGDNTDISSASFTNQFNKFNETIAAINAILAGLK